MGKATDIQPNGVALYFLPIKTRVPLKFGAETLTHVTCARARLRVSTEKGQIATGWGETPLSAQWLWPGQTPYDERHEALKQFCLELAELWAGVRIRGHPMEIGSEFQTTVLSSLLEGFNLRRRRGKEPMPWLAALACCSVYDLALHDAYGQLHGLPVYETYRSQFMNRDLAHYLSPAADGVSFRGRFPDDFLAKMPPSTLRAWHLVGGLDPIGREELTGKEPNDGYPVLLQDWIQRDGLQCLKVKLRGDDAEWDLMRLKAVGALAIENHVEWLSADFNCRVSDADYVNSILDRLRDQQPRIYGMLLYVEQPFPYELEEHPLDVHSVSGRKPLFLDESAHDWRAVRFGRQLGWTGVALKTCKTQTGAVLSACWAKAHGMGLMVQDLTNPMLAQIPHVLLAARVGTIMGVETNGMQFYPDASLPEAKVHPGLYRRRQGSIDVSTAFGNGFGYRVGEIDRVLPEPAVDL